MGAVLLFVNTVDDSFLQSYRNNSPQVSQVKPSPSFSKANHCRQCNFRDHKLDDCPVRNTVFVGRNNKSVLHLGSSLQFDCTAADKESARDTVRNILSCNFRNPETDVFRIPLSNEVSGYFHMGPNFSFRVSQLSVSP